MREQSIHKEQLWSLGGVLALALLVFLPTLGFDFVNWDDYQVVVENPLVQKGLGPEMIREAFTTPQVHGQYAPVTLISFAFNHSVFGPGAWSYHALNLLLHLLNICLVFLIVIRLFHKTWLAAFVALLFAIHPMNVEPVAWVTSRKDVLYLFFMLSAWMMYLKYIDQKKQKGLYLGIAVVLMLLSVLSKSAGIVLPLVLLLTDYLLRRKGLGKIVLEKLPFLVIMLVFTAIGYTAQKSSGAVTDIADHSLVDSIFYASFAFLTYLFKTLIPIRLAAFHPYPAGTAEPMPWYVWASLLPALALAGLWVWQGRKHRDLAFAAGIFVVSIIPFLQLVPVGPSLTAERFSYFPGIGLFILIGLGLERLCGRFPGLSGHGTRWKLALASLCVPLVLLSTRQVGTWKNGESLWTQVLRVHPEAVEAYMNRAQHYLRQGQPSKAMEDYNRCIQVRPDFAGAYNNRGMLLFEQRAYTQALSDFDRSLALDPGNAMAWLNRGLVHMNSGNHAPALQDLDQSIRLDPGSFQAYYNRGFLRGMQGEYALAVQDLDRAISLNPGLPLMYRDRAMAYHLLKSYDQAVEDYSRAVQMDPAYADAYLGRSHSYFAMGDLSRARADALRARELGMSIPVGYAAALGI